MNRLAGPPLEAIRLETGTRLYPWDEPVSGLPVLEHTLAPHQTYDPIDDSTFDELQLTPEAAARVDWSSAVACPPPGSGMPPRTGE